MMDNNELMMLSPKPFRITDGKREVRLGLTASSLDQLEERSRAKLDIDMDLRVRVVLEEDGTEIDDDDYFSTLEPHTTLMILVHEERWTPYKSNFMYVL
jgi:DNA fragmentation factor alpha subunit